MARVQSRSWRNSGATTSPRVVVMRAVNVLCEQCSLQVWAMVSISASVGSRPSAANHCCTTSSSL